MSKEIIKLDVRETDLVNILNVIYQNGYTYVIVHKPTDATRAIYNIEAHIGEQE